MKNDTIFLEDDAEQLIAVRYGLDIPEVETAVSGAYRVELENAYAMGFRHYFRYYYNHDAVVCLAGSMNTSDKLKHSPSASKYHGVVWNTCDAYRTYLWLTRWHGSKLEYVPFVVS